MIHYKTSVGSTVFLVLKSARRFTARHKTVICLLAAMLPVVMRLSLLSYVPIPEPEIYDEFSYLLGADTFASGRVTNPPHPMWVHFETFYINNNPTYCSKYPPAQALFLALGQKVFGHPWYGVLLSVGVMCACICWMLQGWLRPHYAFLGSLLAIANFGIVGYWVNSYWGGAVPAAAGALVLGALPRLVRRESVSTVALGILGVVLLANSRPYEGMILSIASGAALLWWRKRQGRPLRLLFTPPLVATYVVLLSSAAIWFGYYNWRTTGNPWLMPYVVNQRMYASTPPFWLLPEGPLITYRHEIIRELWDGWNREYYFWARANPLRVLLEFVDYAVVSAYAAPIWVSLIIAVLLVPTRRVRIALVIAAACTFGVLMEIAVLAHYFAPAAGLMFFLATAGIQHIMHGLRKQKVLMRTLNLFLLASFFLGAFALKIKSADEPQSGFPVDRAEIIRTLHQQGANQLVLVRYSPGHYSHRDWVFNRANIDKSEIVWARDMGAAANRELLEYYSDRTVWLLAADAKPAVKLEPYPVQQEIASAR